MPDFLQTKTIMISILSLSWWIYSNDPTVSFYFPETLFQFQTSLSPAWSIEDDYQMHLNLKHPKWGHIIMKLVQEKSRGVLNFHFGIGVRPEGPQMGA